MLFCCSRTKLLDADAAALQCVYAACSRLDDTSLIRSGGPGAATLTLDPSPRACRPCRRSIIVLFKKHVIMIFVDDARGSDQSASHNWSASHSWSASCNWSDSRNWSASRRINDSSFKSGSIKTAIVSASSLKSAYSSSTLARAHMRTQATLLLCSPLLSCLLLPPISNPLVLLLFCALPAAQAHFIAVTACATNLNGHAPQPVGAGLAVTPPICAATPVGAGLAVSRGGITITTSTTCQYEVANFTSDCGGTGLDGERMVLMSSCEPSAWCDLSDSRNWSLSHRIDASSFKSGVSARSITCDGASSQHKASLDARADAPRVASLDSDSREVRASRDTCHLSLAERDPPRTAPPVPPAAADLPPAPSLTHPAPLLCCARFSGAAPELNQQRQRGVRLRRGARQGENDHP